MWGRIVHKKPHATKIVNFCTHRFLLCHAEHGLRNHLRWTLFAWFCYIMVICYTKSLPVHQPDSWNGTHLINCHLYRGKKLPNYDWWEMLHGLSNSAYARKREWTCTLCGKTISLQSAIAKPFHSPGIVQVDIKQIEELNVIGTVNVTKSIWCVCNAHCASNFCKYDLGE